MGQKLEGFNLQVPFLILLKTGEFCYILNSFSIASPHARNLYTLWTREGLSLAVKPFANATNYNFCSSSGVNSTIKGNAAN